jgi:LuxR family maltose regulon positive regulatory protein
LHEQLDGMGFEPVGSKLFAPSTGLVSRRPLVAAVQARQADVVTVTAPAGYGKSTFVAELAAADARPTAWLSLSATENDPASLLTYVALAIDHIDPVDPACVASLWDRPPTIGTASFRQFGAMFSAGRRPFVLVLDDVHTLVDRDALDALLMIVTELPAGSSVVLAGRSQVPLPLGRIRVRRQLMELGLGELAFDRDEAALLFAELGVDASSDEIDLLVERSEGWPVATYLGALAQDRGPARVASLADFAGDHRFLVEYLGDELLKGLNPDVAAFLLDASCLDRLSGSLCDEVLQRAGSAQLLERLHRQNLLVIPLDDRRQWYRFHHLMAEFLQSELNLQDPSRRIELHRRASEWFEARSDAEGGIRHAVLSGDLDRAESLVLYWFGRVAGSGRYPTVERWLGLFSADDLLDRPGLMVAAAHGRFRAGQGGAAVQWLDRAGAALPDPHPADAEGAVAPVLLAAARATIAPLTPTQVLAEAQYAHDRAGLGEGHPLSCLMMGAALFMLGDEAQAVRRFDECLSAPLQRALVQASALAHLAVVEIEHGRWPEATAFARRARDVLGPGVRVPPGSLVLAMSVLVETHADTSAAVDGDRVMCQRHLGDLANAAPWLNLQVRVALARAALIRGAHSEAGALLDETAAMLGVAPGAVRVEEQVAALRAQMSAARERSSSSGPASLTTAELRVLQLLPTHLSVAEIAERLFVSRNTVKSQTISIYRKLGTSSRSGAVEIATGAGLLDVIHAFG